MTYPPQQQPAPLPAVSPRLAFWTSGAGVFCIFAIAAAVLVFAGLTMSAFGSSADDDLEVTVTSCSVSGTSLPTARVGLSVRNVGDTTRNATVKIEYRDGSGARVDTDTAYLRAIAPGDTARTEETTLLDASVSSLRCQAVSVR